MPNLTTRFQPGNRLGGRPKGARSRITEKFLEVLGADFDDNADQVIATVRKEDPTSYLKIVAHLVPASLEAKLQIETKLPGNLDADSYATLRRVVELIEALAPAVEPLEAFETIEAALLRAYADPEQLAIEHKPAIPMAIEHALPPPPYQSPEKYT